MFKFSGDVDEMCYPFIYEHSGLCDFEILTDELCTVVGLAGDACETRDVDIQQMLFDLQPLMFNLRAPLKSPSISARVLATYKTRQTLKGMTSPFQSV